MKPYVKLAVLVLMLLAMRGNALAHHHHPVDPTSGQFPGPALPMPQAPGF